MKEYRLAKKRITERYPPFVWGIEGDFAGVEPQVPYQKLLHIARLGKKYHG